MARPCAGGRRSPVTGASRRAVINVASHHTATGGQMKATSIPFRTALPAAAWAMAVLLGPTLSVRAEAQTLEKLAARPADTFAPGPTSGQFITAANSRVPPFDGKQPVQG